MSRTLRAFALISTAFFVNACAPIPTVELRGAPDDTRALVGEWDGSFDSRAAAHSGSIWFKLVAGENHAHGDVLMKSSREPAAYYREPRAGLVRRPNTAADNFLTIHFVRVSRDTVDGILDPYWDPACRCHAVTTFRGEFFENQIRGTFLTHFDDDSIATGSWHVTRRRPKG